MHCTPAICLRLHHQTSWQHCDAVLKYNGDIVDCLFYHNMKLRLSQMSLKEAFSTKSTDSPDIMFSFLNGCVGFGICRLTVQNALFKHWMRIITSYYCIYKHIVLLFIYLQHCWLYFFMASPKFLFLIWVSSHTSAPERHQSATALRFLFG